MTEYPQVIFSPKLIEEHGNIEDVLGRFLDTQMSEISQVFLGRYPSISKSALRKILSRFVTLEGTKAPLRLEEINSPDLNKEQVQYFLQQLETARILRQEDGMFEIAHDTLALHIADQRSTEEIAFLEVVKMIKDRYRVYPQTNTLLNQSELQVVQFNSNLKNEQVLTTEEWAYIEKSKSYQNRQRNLKRLLTFGIIALLSGFSVFSYYQQGIAQQKEQEAIAAQKKTEENLKQLKIEQTQKAEAKYKEHLALGKSFMSQNLFLEAIKEFNTALVFNEKGTEAIELKEKATSTAGVSTRFNVLMEQGLALENQGVDTYVDALAKYQKAKKLNFDNRLAESKIVAIKGKLESVFSQFVSNGDTYLEAEGYEYALKEYNKALRIKPSDKVLLNNIKTCKSKL